MHELLLLLLGLLAQEAVDQIPHQLERLIQRLAAKLPPEEGETMAEVWLAELHALPGKLNKLRYLLPLLLKYRDMVEAANEHAVAGQAEITRHSRAAFDAQKAAYLELRSEQYEIMLLIAQSFEQVAISHQAIAELRTKIWGQNIGVYTAQSDSIPPPELRDMLDTLHHNAQVETARHVALEKRHRKILLEISQLIKTRN